MNKNSYIVVMHYFLGTRKPYIVGIMNGKIKAEKLAEKEMSERGGGYIGEIIEITAEGEVSIYKDYSQQNHHKWNKIEDIYNPSKQCPI